MKNSKLISMVFVSIVAAFTSCSKSSDVYDPGRPEQDAQDLYKKNFLAYVEGPINGAVDWGFGSATVKSGTRAAEAPKVQLGTDQGDGLEGYSTQFSKKFFQAVQEYFPQDAVCKSNDWWNYEFLENGEFFNVRIIYSNTRANDEIGFYYYDPAVETYENHTKVPLYTDIQNDNGNLSEYIQFNRYEEGGQWFPYRTYGSYAIWTEQNAERIRTRAYTIYMNKTYLLLMMFGRAMCSASLITTSLVVTCCSLSSRQVRMAFIRYSSSPRRRRILSLQHQILLHQILPHQILPHPHRSQYGTASLLRISTHTI